MADPLPGLMAFPPTTKTTPKQWDQQAISFVSELSKVHPSTWTKPYDKHPNILDVLDPAINTLPYLFALLTQCHAAGKDRERNEQAATRSMIFFTSFDRIQVRYAGKEWRALLDWAFSTYPQLGIRDFTPLSTAMLRLDPTAGTFTTAHLALVRLSLYAGTPSQALPILDKNIVAFPSAPPHPLPKNYPEDLPCAPSEEEEQSNTYLTTPSHLTYTLKPENILEYHLLGATIYLARRNYARARLFLEYCLLHPSPTHTPSVLQAEAYKKHILLSLLSAGKPLPLPRTIDQALLRSLRALARAYEALSHSFERRNWRKFAAQADVGAGVWAEDGNTRLVKEVSDALLRFRVRDLEERFVALPVSRVGRILEVPGGTAGAVRVLEEVLGAGGIKGAGIVGAGDGSEPVLRFDLAGKGAGIGTEYDDDGEEVEDTDFAAATQRIELLSAALRDADRRLQLTKENLDFQRRRKRVAAAGGAGGAPGSEGDLAEQMDLSWDAPILIDDEEEDDYGGMTITEGRGGFGFGEEGEEDIMGA